MNARLRAAILAARAENMPKDNIERAIKKAAGADGENYDEIRYEGYGPGGVALIVEALTDNRNRTASDIRSYFTKAGGNLGRDRRRRLHVRPRRRDRVRRRHRHAPTTCWRPRIEAGADDCATHEDGHEFICDVEDARRRRRAPSRSASARHASRRSYGGRRTPSRSTRRRAKSCSSSSTRSRTMTTSSTSTPISRSPRAAAGEGRLSGRRSASSASIPGFAAPAGASSRREGNRLSFIACGTVLSDEKDALARRLVAIQDGLQAVVAAHRPDEAAVEETFVNKDATATLKLGQARGIALLVPALAGLPSANMRPTSSRRRSSAPAMPRSGRSD